MPFRREDPERASHQGEEEGITECATPHIDFQHENTQMRHFATFYNALWGARRVNVQFRHPTPVSEVRRPGSWAYFRHRRPVMQLLLNNRSAGPGLCAAAQRIRRATVEALESRQMLSAEQLDPTFGNGGVVTDNTLYAANALVVQSAGKILIATSAPGSKFGHISVSRFNLNGTPDVSFRRKQETVAYVTDSNVITAAALRQAIPSKIAACYPPHWADKPSAFHHAV